MNNPFQKQSASYQDSILFKLAIITVIVLVLLIPSSWIQSLTSDREEYQAQQLSSVADKWAGRQLVQGPVLMLPYKRASTDKAAANDASGTLYVLPQNLHINADIKNQHFQNGIYDAIVYNSKVSLGGSFDKLELASLGLTEDEITYDKARLVFSVSDLKGLQNNPAVKIQQQQYNPEPAIDNTIPFANGLQVNFPLQKGENFTFSYQLDLKGSNELNFLNTGKTTEVEVTSDWPHPSFNGRYLPDSRSVDEKGLNAKWKKLYYNRPFPQQWVNNDTLLVTKAALKEAVFGINLQLPIDQYRKILRTTKYSTLIILLTFVSLFLTELIKKEQIHLFNYILIGAAMVVYYTLLLSLSEQIGYNYAYLVASVSTIVLIALFTASLLKNNAIALVFTAILSVFYGFIFIIIQLEDLSLLFGSIALFIVVALMMYFSRKINWDRHQQPIETSYGH